MNWEAAGAIGEIVGAFAVVVTLIYFALQLKQALRANETQGTVVSSELFSKWRTTLLENTDLAVTLSKANHGLELSDAERTQLYALADELFTAAAVSYAISQHTGATYEQAGEIKYTMSVLESNPGLIPEWMRIRPMVEMVSSDYAIGIDEQISNMHIFEHRTRQTPNECMDWNIDCGLPFASAPVSISQRPVT